MCLGTGAMCRWYKAQAALVYIYIMQTRLEPVRYSYSSIEATQYRKEAVRFLTQDMHVQPPQLSVTTWSCSAQQID